MCEQAPTSGKKPVDPDNLGMIAIDYDCIRDTFRYNSDIGEKLTGVFDERSLWRILLSDGAAREEDITEMRALVQRACVDSDAQTESLTIMLCTANGANRWFWMRVCGEYAADGHAVLLHILFFDVTGEIDERKQLKLQTQTDPLTGLLQRSVFLARVEKLMEIVAPNELVMIYFDIDKFSVINDRYGYTRGDAVLRRIAEAANKACGERGFCSRMHADCFAICMEYLHAGIDRFMENCQAALHASDIPFEIRMSFGLCVIDDMQLSPEVILDHALLAQRSIKGSYVTRYAYYDDAMRKIRMRRQEIEGEMNAALKQGQFDMYLQPQYELATGKLIGAEALARWFHPKRGVVMPGEFVPIFEENGFIGELDAFIWEKACQQLARWVEEDGEDALPISVNISRVNLLGMDVGQKLHALTMKYKIPPRLLRLEITESAYADNPMQIIELVGALQKRGFSVEMDDFGSGYSSLNTLKDVPVSAIKLDMRFLFGDATSGRGGSIINSVVRMTRWLQLPVIAEGVETQQQADYLHSIGCDFVQGYLYAKPMPVVEFDALRHSASCGRYEGARSIVDMEDANAFWNPDSQETLIFNSYVGGAAIMEYAEGHVELLRANAKFRDMMRLEDISRYVNVLDTVMLEEDRALFTKMLEKAIETNDEAICTTRLRDVAKGGESCFWLRNRARVLCKSRSYTIFYIAIDDVTAEHLAQQRYQISQDTLLAAAAHTHLQYWTYNFVENTSVQGVEAKDNDTGLPKYIENYPQALFDLGFVHPDYIEPYRKLHDALKAGEKSVYTDALTGGEGKWEWRRIRYTATPDEDGVVRTAIGTSEPLTAYKELEQRFSIAVKQCGLLTWMLDIKTHCIHTEMLAERSVTQENLYTDLPERYIEMGVVHPDDTVAFKRVYYRMYEGESEAQAVVRCKAFGGGVSGEWCWYRLAFTAMFDKDGRTGMAVCTAMDVTEQVNMQTRYREALAYYEKLNPEEYVSILHANITKGVVEMQQGGTMPYMCAIRQITQRISDTDERARMETVLQPSSFNHEYSKGASRFTYEYRLGFPDGAERWVRTTVRLLMDTSKQELCAFIYTQDINEEKMKTMVFERIVLEDYDFVTIIDTAHDRYATFITDKSGEMVPDAEKYSFSDASELFALTTAPENDAHLYIRETRIPHMLRRLLAEGSYSFTYRAKRDDGSFNKKRITLRLIDERTKHVCLTRMDLMGLEG